MSLPSGLLQAGWGFSGLLVAPFFDAHGSDLTEDRPHLLALKGIEKRFGAVHALKGADFNLAPGQVHALFGANGAGKSTLARVMTGHIAPTNGEILLQGVPTSFKKPRDALTSGIGIVTQETALAGDLSVWENIMLPFYGTAGMLRRKLMRDKAAAALEAIGFHHDLNLDKHCGQLSSAQRQMVEIARAVALDSKVIIFDEPTAALSPGETARLFIVMDRLRAEGHGMVFVSHRLEEIFAITDRITVLRDGRSVANDVDTTQIDQTALIQLMVGRDVPPLKTLGHPPDRGGMILRVEHIGDGELVRNVSFDLHAGEILGLGGLVGSGRSEVTEIIFGLRTLRNGRMELRGKPHTPRGPIDTFRSGIAYLAEDRRRQSIVPDYSVRENILLSALAQGSGLGLDYKSHDARIRSIAQLIELPVARLDESSLLNFSGGMQQKALLIRALLMLPNVLVLDEPTKGRRHRLPVNNLQLAAKPCCRWHGHSAHLVRLRRTPRTLAPDSADQRRTINRVRSSQFDRRRTVAPPVRTAKFARAAARSSLKGGSGRQRRYSLASSVQRPDHLSCCRGKSGHCAWHSHNVRCLTI